MDKESCNSNPLGYAVSPLSRGEVSESFATVQDDALLSFGITTFVRNDISHIKILYVHSELQFVDIHIVFCIL